MVLKTNKTELPNKEKSVNSLIKSIILGIKEK